ncbi:MAG TPA: cholesterol oxidase substrate-binding domain-containing protein [Mycobacteriales bacterium]|nr:cholesterol oxidase substrate-binding domain-containing protein [Mycobacteriales bacterium]
MTTIRDAGPPLPRRLFLAGSAAALATGWMPWTRLSAAADPGCPAPPQFPASIELFRQAYRNWVGEIRVADVWTCLPRQPADVVLLANWAQANGYRLRAQGHAHSWAPLTLTTGDGCALRTVLVDTTHHLTGMQLVSGDPAAVRVQAGAAMEDLLRYLRDAGYGLTAVPAPGDLSVGGALAVDAHGTAVPAAGETPLPGHTYGSLCNLVLSITSVVWDAAAGGYRLRTVDRSEPDCAALLTHLGRAFVTEVTLRVGADQSLRCVSDLTIPADELFSAGTGRTLASYVEQAGRVEAIWFPFTDRPWLKVWSVSPNRPLTSRPAVAPYNYPFSDNVPEPVARLAGRIVSGEPELAPAFGQAQFAATAAGLAATGSADLWGPSANLLLYVRPTTMRLTANGYAVLTSRANIQRVVAEFVAAYQDLLTAYQTDGRYPVNGPVEIRVTGLDQPADPGVPGARPPGLSALRPRPDHPEWTVAVWLDLLTLPASPYVDEFYRRLEEFVLTNYTGYAMIRPEWSKGWAYTDAGAWTNQTVLTGTVPAAYRQGPDPSWDATLATLNRLDPHRTFTNPFLNTLLP